jgi:hypothetical protein
MRVAAVFVLWALAAAAQNYSGPKPPKPDIPYLVHADTLVATEAAEAKEQRGKKDEILYIVPGASSPAATPLASPIFLFLSEKVDPSRLQLYKLTPRAGQREILFRKNKSDSRPIRTDLNRVSGNLYRIEVGESLQAGEYSLTPEGSNQVFCFQVK